MEKSIFSLVPARYLVDYFDLPNVHYFSHGVNIDTFKPNDTTPIYHSLLMLANNGLGGYGSYDRKGFELGVKVAMSRNLPITIAGPKNNENWFNDNPWVFGYPKLSVLNEPSNEQSNEQSKAKSIELSINMQKSAIIYDELFYDYKKYDFNILDNLKDFNIMTIKLSNDIHYLPNIFTISNTYIYSKNSSGFFSCSMCLTCILNGSTLRVFCEGDNFDMR
jgi:hypothetical protein